jgi:hypothetical protein
MAKTVSYRRNICLLIVAVLACAAVGRSETKAAGEVSSRATEQHSSAALAPLMSRLGMNLAGPTDWSTEFPFVDVFHLSRKWISQRRGTPWGKGPELERDANGWITRLAPDCWADTPLLTESHGHAPTGDYVCLYEGEGTIDFSNSKIVSRQSGRMVVRIDASRGGTFLSLRSTNPANYVRNIRVIMPGFEGSYRDEPFYPPFLQRWHEFNTFRFMDWMLTNGSRVSAWQERPTPGYCNCTEHGMPVETMVDLCNRLRVNPWFCMPHLASDDYVRHFARLVRQTLHPSLEVYLEYSNEVWNSQFPQHQYAEAKGKELSLGHADRPWEGAGMFYAQRSVEIFRIWEEAFGGHQRLVRVIAWQAAGGSYWNDKIVLSHQQAYRHTDALAIAPYITMCIGPKSKPDAQTVAQWNVEQVLDYAENEALPKSLEWIKIQKQVAENHGIKLVCYEAGQHLVGVAGGENNEALTQLFRAANRHPRMGAIYTKYLDAWRDLGGDLMCIFSSTARWSKWGSWGLTEYLDETDSDQPKFKAVTEWNRANPRRIGRAR